MIEKQRIKELSKLVIPLLIVSLICILHTQVATLVFSSVGDIFLLVFVPINLVKKLHKRLQEMCTNMLIVNRAKIDECDYNKLYSNVVITFIGLTMVYTLLLYLGLDFYLSLFNLADKQVYDLSKVWLCIITLYGLTYNIAYIYHSISIQEKDARGSSIIMGGETIINMLLMVLFVVVLDINIYIILPIYIVTNVGVYIVMYKYKKDIHIRLSEYNMKWSYTMLRGVLPIFSLNLTDILEGIVTNSVLGINNVGYVVAHNLRCTVGDIISNIAIPFSDALTSLYADRIHKRDKIGLIFYHNIAKLIGCILGIICFLCFTLFADNIVHLYLETPEYIIMTKNVMYLFAFNGLFCSIYILTVFSARGLGIVKEPSNIASVFVLSGIVSALIFREDTKQVLIVLALLETLKHLSLIIYVEYKVREVIKGIGA